MNNSESINNVTLSYPSNVESRNPKKEIEKLLNGIFPTSEEESKLARARSLLGVDGKKISDAQLEAHIGQFEYLINNWLDIFEKNLFRGKTLKEMIKDPP